MAGRPGKPTLLVYGHYDVQPAEPLEPWLSPPFEPTERGGNLYARGATDDKGQMFTHLKAAEAWLKTTGKLPINVKFVIEGEEEVGGANLEAYMANQAKRLACDYAVISDSSQFAPGRPRSRTVSRGSPISSSLCKAPTATCIPEPMAGLSPTHSMRLRPSLPA